MKIIVKGRPIEGTPEEIAKLLSVIDTPSLTAPPQKVVNDSPQVKLEDEILKKQLQTLYVDRGLSLRNTAKILGKSHIFVRDWVKKFNFPIKPRGKRGKRGKRERTREQTRGKMIETAKQLYVKEHMSIQKCANKMGDTPSHVYSLLLKGGVKMRKQGTRCHYFNHRKPWDKLEIDRLQNLCDDNNSTSEIAKHLGRTQDSVKEAIKRLRAKGLIKTTNKRIPSNVKVRYPNYGTPWTEADVEFLMNLRIKKASMREMIRQLGRTRSSIINACTQWKLN
jgi:transposase